MTTNPAQQALSDDVIDLSESDGLLASDEAQQLDSLVESRLARGVTRDRDTAPILARQPGDSSPLSYAQQRLWFLQHLVGDSPFYTESSAIRVQTFIDPVVLTRTINEIVRRHEVLRTSFFEIDGELVQRSASDVTLEVPVVDLGSLPPDTQRFEVDRLAIESARHTFDLRSAPLLKASLVRLGDNDWVFLFAIHHIACDGWSTAVFSRELAEIYSAFAQGLPSPLPDLAIQYADFATWQRGWLTDDELAAQIGYWSRQLAGLPMLELPMDRPRPPVFSYEGAHLRFEVDDTVAAALRRLSNRHNATMFMTLLSGFVALLHRYTGQEDIAIGCPVANRTRRELEDLIGFFVNTLVLRVDLSGEATFDELVDAVRRVSLDAFDHQDVPFEQLVNELHPQRDLSRNPLFQTIFQLRTDDSPGAVAQAPGGFAEIDIERAAVKFDLRLDMIEGPNGLHGVVEFSTDLFDVDRIQRLIDHFLMMLTEMATHPNQAISKPVLMTASEAQVVARWGRVTEPSPVTGGVFGHFVRQALETPEATALKDDSTTLTYRALAARVQRLAEVLVEAGARPHTVVALSATRSLDTVVAVMATVAAGCAYMPIDPSYPDERIAAMLTRADASIVVADESEHHRFAPHASELVAIAVEPHDSTVPLADLARLPGSALGPDDLAYVMFTSGSTGEPKAVMIPHRGIIRLVSHADYVDLGPSEVVLLLAPLTFDASTLELWGPLLTGATLVVASDGPLDPNELRATLARHEITTLWLTSGVFHHIADQDVEAIAGVRQLLSGGDVLRPAAIEQVLRHAPECRVINGYGPTENTTFSCCHQITSADVSSGDSIPIGHPIRGSHAVVIDDDFRPAPLGVPGQLGLGGDGLAWGYLDDPRATAERFVPNPFSVEAGARLYLSGDLAQWRADGMLQFLGRRDRQLKVRGFRVEPGEIESQLEQHPGVGSAAVVAHQAPEGRRLVAYVTPSDASRLGSGLVDDWQELYDELYEAPATPADTADFRGWNSSITDEAIPEESMTAWLDDTIAVLNAGEYSQVLEIGVGTGLIMNEIAPTADRYVATDLSPTTIAHLHEQVEASDLAAIIELHAQAADNLENLRGPFDLIIVNSVVQYFPSVDYLDSVLSQAFDLLSPGGRLVIGDVRSLAHLDAFHAEVELADAGDKLAADVLAQARRRASQEQELVLNHDFFDDFAAQRSGACSAHIAWKPSEVDTELFRYRYDVTLSRKPDAAEDRPQPVALEWTTLGCLSGLESTLQERRSIVVYDVPNERLVKPSGAARILSEVDPATPASEIVDRVRQLGEDAVSGRELRSLADRNHYRFAMSPSSSGAPELMDLSFEPIETGVPMYAARPDRSCHRSRPRHQLPHGNQPGLAAHAAELIPRLRTFVDETLPGFMAPASFVVVDHIPLTANGKLDRKALPPPDDDRPAATHEFVAAGTDVERALCQIWASVIGVSHVGIRDNFFELGGDSIQCIQIIARARSAGHSFTAKMLFEHQTIEDLAPFVTQPTTTTAEQGRLSGVADLLPAQLWFLERDGPGVDHFNQSVMLELPTTVDIDVLSVAIERLVEHHDALRMSFAQSDSIWTGTFDASETAGQLERTHHRDVHDSEIDSVVERWASAIQTDLSVGDARCFRAAWLDLGSPRTSRLFLATHHLVVDGVSWRILLQDLWETYTQLATGQAVELPAKTSSVRDWSAQLAQHAVDAETLGEVEHWMHQASEASVAIPLDHSGENIVADVLQETMILDAERTQRLLTQIPKATGRHIDDILVTALVRVLCRWCDRRDVSIDIEGHGREEISPAIDLSRTVGWFTSIAPALLTINPGESLQQSLRAVGESLAVRRHRGLGFGVLRYCSPDGELRRRLSDLPARQVSFNYLGQLGRTGDESTITGASEPQGPMRDPAGQRVHLIEVDGSVVDDQLTFTWNYSSALHESSTIEQLANDMAHELRTIVDEFSIDGMPAQDESFPAASVAQSELHALLARVEKRSSGGGS